MATRQTRPRTGRAPLARLGAGSALLSLVLVILTTPAPHCAALDVGPLAPGPVLSGGVVTSGQQSDDAPTYDIFIQHELAADAQCAEASPCLVGVGAESRIHLDSTMSLGLAFLSPATQVNAIEYSYFTDAEALCRLEGYLEYCSTPYSDPPGTDATHPALVDYALREGSLGDISALEPPPPSDLAQFPFLVNGMVPVYNVGNNNPAINIRLTGEVLARMYRGCVPSPSNPACVYNTSRPITSWADADILALNDPSTYETLRNMGTILRVFSYQASAYTREFTAFMGFYDADFAEQVPSVDNSQWPGVDNITWAAGNSAVIALASTIASSIAFLDYPGFVQAGLQAFQVVNDASNPAGSAYPVTAASIALAAELAGPAFGNDGTDPAFLSMNIGPPFAGQGVWPFTFLVYFLARTDYVRDASWCSTRSMLSAAYEFTTSSTLGAELLGARNFVPLPASIAAPSLAAFQASFRCNGSLVSPPTGQTNPIAVYAPPALYDALASLVIMQGEDLDVALTTPLTVTQQQALVGAEYQPAAWLLVADENMSQQLMAEPDNIVSFPLSAVGLAFLYNFCLPNDNSCAYINTQVQLDVTTVAMILQGDISWWNDTRILSQQVAGALIPPLPILMFSGPFDLSHEWVRAKLQQCCLAEFEFAEQGVTTGKSLANTVTIVTATIGAFMFAPLNQTLLEWSVNAVALLNNAGAYVIPSSASISACANDSYLETTQTFDLDASTNSGCYPLSEVVSLVVQQNVLNASTINTVTNASVGCAVGATVAGLLNFTMNHQNTMQAYNLGGFGSTVTAHDTGARVDLAALTNAKLASLACEGASLLQEAQDLQLIPAGLLYSLYAVAALGMFMCFALAVWTSAHRNRKLVRNSSPAFLLQTLAGAFVMMSTTFALGQQDSQLQPIAAYPNDAMFQPNAYLNAACQVQPWLFSVGFALMYSALFLKAWRLVRLFNNIKLRHLFIRDCQLFRYQVIVLGAVVVLNLIWLLTTPFVWLRSPTALDQRNGLVLASQGTCYSPAGIAPAMPLFAFIVVSLLVGTYLAYCGRRIPTEYNESQWTAMAMIVNFQCMVLGIPVLVLAWGLSTSSFAIKTLLSVLPAAATVLLVFVPKLLLAYDYVQRASDSNPWQIVGGKGSSSADGRKTRSRDAPAVVRVGGGGGAAESSGTHASVASPAHQQLQAHVPGSTGGARPPVSSVSVLLDDSYGRAGARAVAPRSPVPSSGRSAPDAGVVAVVPASSQAAPRGTVVASSPNAATSGGRPPTLADVLDEDDTRRRLRRFLATQQAEENVRFLDAVDSFAKEPDGKRAASAKAIIHYFVLDTAPKQINLKAQTRARLVALHKADDRAALAELSVFNDATREIVDDIKHSDGFKRFLEANERGTATNLTGPSDSSLS